MTTPNSTPESNQPQQSQPDEGSADASLNASAKRPHPSRWWPWVVLAAVIVVAIVASLWIYSSNSSNNKSATTDSKVADTVTIGLTLAPTNLDIRNQSGAALDQALIGNVYEGLVARNSDNKVVPALASSWDESSDGKTYTFHLNKNVTFSNGDELNSADAVWSIQQLVNKQLQDSQSLAGLDSVTAPDANTVEITLKKPDASLLWALSGRAGLVLDKDAKYDAKTTAVGSGPFLLDSFRENESLTFKANPKYWGKNKAKTKQIVLRYFADDNTAVNALKSGDVQVLAPIVQNLASSVSNDSNFVVKTGDGTDKFVLAFNNKGKYTADKRVRQALRYAIDNDQLIASRGGVDSPLGGPIPSLDPGYEDLTDEYPHDPTKAKELLAEAGYDAQHPLKLNLEYANIYGPDLGNQLTSQFKEVGVELNVKVVEFSAWLQDVYTNKDYDLSLVDHNESHDFYQWATPDYYYNYDNPKVQSLYTQATESPNEEEYDSLLKQAAKIVSQDAPADWLFNYRVTTAYHKGVSGFPVNLNQSVLALRDVVYQQ